ncbi:zinc metalloprotease [Algoriphagus litoralis]|uniref:hypothetical protein n=1 Tax=Algoriphagus litoralis TaxID=2202829 RepID=UPI000DBAD69B|nr:hypothetical protein [Algoriphagus litoralis]
MNIKKISLPVITAILIAGCSQELETNSPLADQSIDKSVEFRSNPFGTISVSKTSPNGRQIGDPIHVRLVSAEYLTNAENREMGNTIIFEDRGNKQLAFDFSPFVSLDGTQEIEYFVDQVRPPQTLDLTAARQSIIRAANTWKNVSCSNIGIEKTIDIPVPLGLVAAELGFPSIPGFVAEINHNGWMPASFFDFLAPNGSQGILAVTFTFLVIDNDGEFVDTNSDGKFDVAFREIYYNDNFIWADGGSGVDTETIALHEMGHGLSQEHFGAAFITKKGDVKFAPRAVMNAAYSGPNRIIKGTDNAGHCSIWGNWPNN